MYQRNPLKELYAQLLNAPSRKEARRVWKKVQAYLNDPGLSPRKRREAYLWLRENARQEVILRTDELYGQMPQAFPQRLLAYLNVIVELRGLAADSVPRAGDFERTLPYHAMHKALGLCETEEQVYQTLALLQTCADTLPCEDRDTCLRQALRVVEDTILAIYLDSVPRLNTSSWRDHFITSLLTTVDLSPLEEYTLGFAHFNGTHFILVNENVLADCRDERKLVQYLRILHKGLCQMPSEQSGHILSRLAEKLPIEVLRQITQELAENHIGFGPASAFLAHCLEDIDSGEICIGVRETGEAGGTGTPRDVLAVQDAAVDLTRFAEAEDLCFCWDRLLRAFRSCPCCAPMLTGAVTRALSTALFQKALEMQPEGFAPSTMMRMRFCFALWGGGRWLSDGMLRAWVLGEKIVLMEPDAAPGEARS